MDASLSNKLYYNRFELKGSELDPFCPQTIVYFYLEFKLRYLKNLNVFSIRVKVLFEPILCEKK